MPTTDIRKAMEQARTPLLAALGAGDLAAQAVVDAVGKARTQVNERTEQARSAVDGLPNDVSSLREKLDPAELRKLVEQYQKSLQDLYGYLSQHGEKALDKLRAQPQVNRALTQFEEAVETAQTRLEDVTGDARELADDVLGKVTKRTRSVGEKSARATEKLADDVSEAVQEAGDEVAHETRSASRKAANRTAPRKSTTRASTKTTAKTTGTPKTTK